MSRDPAIIVDIDGTVADKGEREPFDYSKVYEDTVIQPIADLLNYLTNEHVMLYVSGREDSCRYSTRQWLRDKRFVVDELFMRKSGDYRSDVIVKREIYFNEIEPKYNVRWVFDDRNKVVAMWRDLGLTVLQVADGDF